MKNATLKPSKEYLVDELAGRTIADIPLGKSIHVGGGQVHKPGCFAGGGVEILREGKKRGKLSFRLTTPFSEIVGSIRGPLLHYFVNNMITSTPLAQMLDLYHYADKDALSLEISLSVTAEHDLAKLVKMMLAIRDDLDNKGRQIISKVEPMLDKEIDLMSAQITSFWEEGEKQIDHQ